MSVNVRGKSANWTVWHDGGTNSFGSKSAQNLLTDRALYPAELYHPDLHPARFIPKVFFTIPIIATHGPTWMKLLVLSHTGTLVTIQICVLNFYQLNYPPIVSRANDVGARAIGRPQQMAIRTLHWFLTEIKLMSKCSIIIFVLDLNAQLFFPF